MATKLPNDKHTQTAQKVMMHERKHPLDPLSTKRTKTHLFPILRKLRTQTTTRGRLPHASLATHEDPLQRFLLNDIF
jgi:hypothetical protein